MKKIFFVGIIIISIIAIGISGYVLWNNQKVTITFITNNVDNIENMKVKKGDSINLPILERNGYSFLGWYVNDEKIDNNYQFDKETILTAKWEKDGELEKKYTVVFDTNGGGNIQSQVIKDGERVIEPSTPIKNGYVFKEWQLNGARYDFNSVVTSDITLIANWQDCTMIQDGGSGLTVKFNTNGGSKINDMKVCLTCAPKKVELPYPTKEGYKFAGWYADSNLTKAVTGGIKTIEGASLKSIGCDNSETTIYAKWIKEEKEVVGEEYTVEFYIKDTYSVCNCKDCPCSKITPYYSVKVKKGEKVKMPSNPAWTDKTDPHTFKEWQLNGQKFDENMPITENLKIYAKWEKENVKKYTVTFKVPCPCSIISSSVGTEGTSTVCNCAPTKYLEVMVNEGEKVTKPADPVLEGLKFVDWLNGRETYDFNKPVTSDLTLIAKMERSN